jgi:hypothetical protein
MIRTWNALDTTVVAELKSANAGAALKISSLTWANVQATKALIALTTMATTSRAIADGQRDPNK